MKNVKYIMSVVLLLIIVNLVAGEYSNFFWQVEKGDVVVSLCGSVHLMKPEYYPMREEIEQAFESADALVLEIDLNKIDLNKIQELISSKGIYGEGESLESELSAEYYEKLKSELADYQYEIESVKNQKPWYMTMTLSSVRVSALGYTAEGGTDLYFMLRAGDSKEILQLETPELQFELLSSMADSLQIEYLQEIIDQRVEYNQQVEELMQSWIDGDDESMYRLMNEELKQNPKLAGFYDELIRKRNLEMTNKIEKYLDTEGEREYFVVVGSGHFLGEEGIVNLLRERGYTVTRK
ncbi:MAG: TraB/GumN family protein [Candidatus Cloacimonetes bacterium]|nr:TraB/GumN family protein [Candidatus Cloacimonadota bacterium]